MHRFWNAACACISLLWFIKIITNTFMRDCTYHTFCFISICICYITIFKNPLNMLYIFDFVSSKTKHAIACWVLQQINNLYLLRGGTHHTSSFNTTYILLASSKSFKCSLNLRFWYFKTKQPEVSGAAPLDPLHWRSRSITGFSPLSQKILDWLMNGTVCPLRNS